LNAALADKCIIIDEEEDVIDEFPPLTQEQQRVVNFALHGARHEVNNFFNEIIFILFIVIADYRQQV
jgi:hypothetical protein